MEKTKINKFIVNYYKNDNVIGKTISRGQLWGIETKQLFQRYYRPNSNILDIGGFIGTVSLVLSEIIDEGYKIHVFEPQYFECLNKNIIDNNLENVIIPYKYGLSHINGFIPNNNINFNEPGNYGGRDLTTLYDKTLEEYTIDETENCIELKRLDDFKFDNIGLIKLDVEGFELLVLKGGIETLKNNNFPTIFIEIWDTNCWRNKDNTRSFYKQNKKDIIAFLIDLKYKMVWNRNDDYIFKHPENVF